MLQRFESKATSEASPIDMSGHFSVTRDPSIDTLVDLGLIPGVSWDNAVIGETLAELGEPEELAEGILPIEIRLAGDDFYQEMIKVAPASRAIAEVVESEAGMRRVITLPLFVRLPEIPELNYLLANEEQINLTLAHELKHAVDFTDQKIGDEQKAYTTNMLTALVRNRNQEIRRRFLPIDFLSASLALGSVAYAAKTRRFGHFLAAVPLVLATDYLSSLGEAKLINNIDPDSFLEPAREKMHASPMEVRAQSVAEYYETFGVPPMISFRAPETT